jgi:hypothetical protein
MCNDRPMLILCGATPSISPAGWKTVRSFIPEIVGSGRTTRLGRLNRDPACPKVVGLMPAHPGFRCGAVFGVGQAVGAGSGFDAVAAEGESVDDARAQRQPRTLL